MLGLLYGLLGLALAVIVWPTEEPKVFGGLAGSEWRVVEIGGAKVGGAGSVRFTHTSVRGRAACNAFFGAFRETQGAIEIGGINETRMACGGQSGERSFIDSLTKARSYRVDGETIVLIDADGRAVLRLAS